MTTQRGIWMKEYTPWTRIQIAVLAFFKKNNNVPATYREIARAYGKSNYPDYKKSCDSLARKGYLVKLGDGSFQVSENSWEMVKSGKETIERRLPYFDIYLKKSGKLTEFEKSIKLKKLAKLTKSMKKPKIEKSK